MSGNEIIVDIKREYGIVIENVSLIRDWVGKVYLISNQGNKYILKQYKDIVLDSEKVKKSENENQDTYSNVYGRINTITNSLKASNYLYENGIDVPKIINTVEGKLCTFISSKDNDNIKYLTTITEFIEGKEVVIDKEEDKTTVLLDIGKYWGKMSKVMQSYNDAYNIYTKDFFTARYIDILEKKHYSKTYEYIDNANSLWNNVKDISQDFMHGDFHAGNMFFRNNNIVLYDFDTCGMGYAAYDIATMCDTTNYFEIGAGHFKEEINRLENNVKTFINGCQRNKEYKVDNRQIAAFIALRHYDIQATIVNNLGINCIDDIFIDNQLKWINEWMMATELNHKKEL